MLNTTCQTNKTGGQKLTQGKPHCYWVAPMTQNRLCFDFNSRSDSQELTTRGQQKTTKNSETVLSLIAPLHALISDRNTRPKCRSEKLLFASR